MDCYRLGLCLRWTGQCCGCSEALLQALGILHRWVDTALVTGAGKACSAAIYNRVLALREPLRPLTKRGPSLGARLIELATAAGLAWARNARRTDFASSYFSNRLRQSLETAKIFQSVADDKAGLPCA